VREINESFAKSPNQNVLKRLANLVHFYNKCYSKGTCPETPSTTLQANAALLHQSILWLLRLVNLVILVVSSEFIHSASEFSAAELTMKRRN